MPFFNSQTLSAANISRLVRAIVPTAGSISSKSGSPDGDGFIRRMVFPLRRR